MSGEKKRDSGLISTKTIPQNHQKEVVDEKRAFSNSPKILEPWKRGFSDLGHLISEEEQATN